MPHIFFRLLCAAFVSSGLTVGMGLTWWETGHRAAESWAFPIFLAAVLGIGGALVGHRIIHYSLLKTRRFWSKQPDVIITSTVVGLSIFVVVAESYDLLAAMSFLLGYTFVAISYGLSQER